MPPPASDENAEAVAHATEGGATRHLLVDHLRAVGSLSAKFVEPFCDPAWGDLAGRWHDLGKYADDFQRMIRSATGIDAHVEDETVPGRVDHSSAGAVHAIRQLGDNPYGKALAAVIAGHHCGLVDLTDLDARLAIKGERLASALAGRPATEVLAGARPHRPPTVRASASAEEQHREWEFWVRMLFSALVDADSLDTEAFYSGAASDLRKASATIPTLRATFERHVAKLSGEGPVNEIRRSVQAACVAASLGPQGTFTLSVPTGGGKTFASTLFALAHAEAHGLRRVIIVPPFTSIIEQTARALRLALGDQAVLEHHSAVDTDRQTKWNLLASENWDAPLIVTTAVQFLESLFARKRSRCRKLHNIARSVVVLDEAQTLPPTLLAPILDVLQTLVESYGVSLVLSTATQPALARRPYFPLGFPILNEIAPAPAELARALRRVEVRWPKSLDAPETW
jgi:CRISPR-associated endonuclease/helicase Cas3